MMSRYLHKSFKVLPVRSGGSSGSSPNVFGNGEGFASVLLRIFIGLSVLFGPLVRNSPAKSGLQGNPHHFQQSCDNCHALAVSADNNDDQRRIGPLHREINRSCGQAGCHEQNVALSHPVGIKPGGYTPPEMPLDAKGRITCLTCHDELNGANPKRFPAFLRRSAGRDFCASCHATFGGTAKERSHWQFTNKAHLAAGESESVSTETAEHAGNIDLESYTCLGCHDNISAVVPRDNESELEKMRRRSEMSDHPIGMTYALKAARNSSDFNMLLRLDNRIRFFNGRLGCGSCHNLYSDKKNHLVLPSSDGALCRECHIR